MKNPIDAVVGFFSPTAALKRARARHAMRIYDGASFGYRNTSSRALHTSANAEIQLAMRPLRDRVRELARNSPYVPRMLDIFTAHAIGVGLRPVPRTGADKLDAKVEALWCEWTAEADVEGVLSFEAQQALALRSTMESGEVVGRFVDQELRSNRRNKIPMNFQLLEADFIDQWREGIYGAGSNYDTGLTPDTIRTRLGVGLGENDFRTGLWLLPWHPGEITTYNMRPGISRFYPRDEVLHVFRQLRPGQVRGVPWFAPILMTARDLADYLDAVVVKARVEACFAAFVENAGDDIGDTVMDAIPDPTTPRGPPLTMLEPGMIKELRAGQKITFANPSSSASQVEPMIMHPVMAMAAAVGVTYDQVTGDLRGANYSSLRAGKIEFRRLVEQMQHLVLIPRLCQPVWNRFINRAILAGELRERADGYPCDWVTPAWESVNPKYDFEAEEWNVRSGRVSPQEFIAGWGNDWRKTLDDFEEFYKEADKRGLVFDIDPRKVTRTGQAQPVPGGAAGAGDDAEGPGGKPNGKGGDNPDHFDARGGSEGRPHGPFRLTELLERLFDEAQHPRDKTGKWTDKGGGTDGGSGKEDTGGKEEGSASGGAGRAGAGSAEQAQRSAEKAAAGYAKLEDLPVKPIKIGDEWYVPGPFGKAKAAAEKYAREAGITYDPPTQYLKVDKARATRIANEFDQMKHDPENAEVKASYDALIKETIAQWHVIRDTGLKVEWIKPGQDDPYAATPRLAAMDVINNNHWWGFPTDAGFGSGEEAEKATHNNPMLQMTDEVVDGRKLMANDVFRIVHDYFGHFAEGVGFRADGEENAWRSHAAMYSDLARGAMTSETRGQNSWVNYGPYGESNRTASAADTHYAPQKIGLMPEWTRTEGRRMLERLWDESKHPRIPGGPKGGQFTAGEAAIDPVATETDAKASVAEASKASTQAPMPGSKATHPATIASRQPTNVGATKDEYRQPTVEAMKLDPENYEHDVGLFKNAAAYPNFRPDELSGTTDENARTLIDHFKSNIRFLYDKAEDKEHSKLWYDGARLLVENRAKRYGYNDASVAAVYAALSPQKDWDVNVHLGDELMHVYATRQSYVWDDEMTKTAGTIWKKDNWKKIAKEIDGKTLGELDTPIKKAIWIRTYDEAHSSRFYRQVNPDGSLGKFAYTKPGKLARAAWQTTPNIANAVKAIEANGDRDKISDLLGARHKVRSFYNNILDPHAANGDVTIDTHAVGAALLRPLGGSSVAVAQNFADWSEGTEGASASVVTGTVGTYPIYADAYREVAKDLGIEPRQLQSIVWVTKRRLFDRGLTDKQEQAINSAWDDYHEGKADLAATQAKVYAIAIEE